MRVLSLLAALALAVFGLAEATAYVAVYVESTVEIPPLAYFNGTHYMPVHVYYVAKWEKAVWFGEVVEIPVWDFKHAIIFIPNEAFKAKTPPRPLGVLEVAVEGKRALLVEAPDEALVAYGYLKERPAEAKRANTTWIRQPTKRGLGDKPTPQPRDAKREPEPIEPEPLGPEPLYTGSPPSVYPDGAFYFNKTTRYMVAGYEYCLPVRTISSSYSRPWLASTLAVLGYNASWIWRVAWRVYYSGWPLPSFGEELGRGVAKVYVTDPELQQKSQPTVVGEWKLIHLGGGVAFLIGSAPIPYDLQNKHLALELCFRPSRSGTFTVGANATVGFVKNVNRFAYAVGDYYLGVKSETGQEVSVTAPYLPVRNVLLGPFALADGYYSADVEWHIRVMLYWSGSNCPTLTAKLYVGHNAESQIDTATGTLISSERLTSGWRCTYEIGRLISLHTNAMGFWYDEARALEKGVYFRIELSHGAHSIRLYKVEMRGKRYVQNFIDKPTREWRLSSLLRGFYSAVPLPSFGKVPNRTSPVYVNVEVLHRYTEAEPELVNVYLVGVNSDPRILLVRLHISPKDAYGGYKLYTKGERYEEPWYISMFFSAASIAKSILDFLEKLPGPVSVVADLILDIRSGAYGDISVEDTPTGKRLTWRSGYAESYRYVGIGLGTNQEIQRTIEVEQVIVSSNLNELSTNQKYTLTLPGMKFTDFSDYEWQRFQHWAHRIRLDVETPLRVTR